MRARAPASTASSSTRRTFRNARTTRAGGGGGRETTRTRGSAREGRATQRRDVARRAQSDAMYGISTEPSDEDVKTFNRIIQATSWEGIVSNVKASANGGELTTGVLGAGYLVFTESKKRGENEQTLGVLQNIIQVMTQALMTMSASPAQRVMDELMELPVSEERKLVDRIEEAYNDGIDTYAIAECLRDFIKNLQVQEMSFDLEVAKAKEAKWDDQIAKLEVLAQERIEAQKRAMNILKLIGADAPPAMPAMPAVDPNAAGPSPAAGAFEDQTD